MDKQRNKHFYKVISLFIKSTILILSFWYIWQKIKNTPNKIHFSDLTTTSNLLYFVLVCLLMLVNWSLEALKWQTLITPLESISFSKAIKSILAGVTISIFTPNRTGEFIGRVFFLDEANKIQASVISIVGSGIQLLITIIAGVSAYYFLEANYSHLFQNQSILSDNLLYLIIAFIFIACILFFIYYFRNKILTKYKKYIDAFSSYSKREVRNIIGFSLIRYFVFSIQYFLVLKINGIDAENTLLFSLIALTFLATSAIPTFALTEIATRSATAVYFFSTIHPDSNSVITASLLLWIINLAIPALIGFPFVWKFKLFKN
jgi:hypothetical protein